MRISFMLELSQNNYSVILNYEFVKGYEDIYPNKLHHLLKL